MMCVTLGVGHFIATSKMQKLNSKSSTEAEIIAVSDGNIVTTYATCICLFTDFHMKRKTMSVYFQL